jgi:hypothetical protein
MCPKTTNFAAGGWSGIEGGPDFASAILRPPLVPQLGSGWAGNVILSTLS